MVSLFSVFDPVSYLGFSMNWGGLVFVLLIIPVGFFVSGGLFEEMWVSILEILGVMFKEISSPKYMGLIVVSMVLFVYISMINVMGLFPYFFSSSGHIVVTLSLGLLMWMMSMVMGWFSSFKMMSAHLVPEGSPLFLAPFMVVIEMVSQLIRPVTLSVRLAANMMAGHLIIGLISTMSENGFFSFWFSVLMLSMMFVLEWAVCFIQAFVFSILVMLYALESY